MNNYELNKIKTCKKCNGILKYDREFVGKDVFGMFVIGPLYKIYVCNTCRLTIPYVEPYEHEVWGL